MKNNHLLITTSLMVALSIMCASFVYAEDPSDATTGPGVGLPESSWNGQGRIYTMGNNGIEGSAVVAANALEVAPTTVESNILNPINNYAIDMGPTTAANWQLTLHNIADGGPGTGLDSSIITGSKIYNNVGPGADIPKEEYVDLGPILADATTTNVDPSNVFIDMGPKSSTEIIYSKKK